MSLAVAISAQVMWVQLYTRRRVVVVAMQVVWGSAPNNNVDAQMHHHQQLQPATLRVSSCIVIIVSFSRVAIEPSGSSTCGIDGKPGYEFQVSDDEVDRACIPSDGSVE